MISKLKSIKPIYSNLIFKIMYMLHLFLSILVYTTGNKISLCFLMVTAFIIICYRLLNIKDYISYKNTLILILFVVSYILSNLFYLKYGVVDQVEQLVWLLFHFFLLYTNSMTQEKDEIKTEIKIISVVLMIIVNIGSIVSLWMLFNNFNTVVTSVDGKMFVTGLTAWGRLFGIYTDPNYSSVLSIVVIFLAYFYGKKDNKFRLFYIITILIQILFIIFVQSRTAQVSIIIGLIAYVLIKLYYSFSKKQLLNCFIVISMVIILVLYGFPKTIEVYSNMINSQNEVVTNVKTEEIENEIVTIGRTDSKEVDISNRRFDIWKSGLEIYSTSPMFGVGFRNVVPYSYEYLPNTYIVSNDFAIFDAFHNTIIDVLVGQGLIGIILLIVLVYKTISYIFKNIKGICKEDLDLFSILLATCIMIASSAMFISHIFYVNNITTYCFWLLFGYTMYFMKNSSNKNNEL